MRRAGGALTDLRDLREGALIASDRAEESL